MYLQVLKREVSHAFLIFTSIKTRSITCISNILHDRDYMDDRSRHHYQEPLNRQ
jgi:hypothetical protein